MTGDEPKYKFQRLQIYQIGLDYVDATYKLTNRFPRSENLNLRSQLERAANSVVLNTAEGSTGQTDPEQARFLGLSLRSLMECVACLDLVKRRNYVPSEELTPVDELGHKLFVKIQAMRRVLRAKPKSG